VRSEQVSHLGVVIARPEHTKSASCFLFLQSTWEGSFRSRGFYVERTQVCFGMAVEPVNENNAVHVRNYSGDSGHDKELTQLELAQLPSSVNPSLATERQ